jgi:hypothetical protein
MHWTRNLSLLLVPLLAACSGGGDDGVQPLLPNVDDATFVAGIDNPYFPLPVGATWAYEAMGEEGLERIEILVLDPADITKQVAGDPSVPITIVEDTVFLDGEVIEYTHDWYAQDSEGNVWYLGEDTCEFEPGTFDPNGSFEECTMPIGAWEWGEDGALPGIIMPADPAVDGRPYYQEYYVGEAEDVGEVIEVGLSLTVAAGSFTDCIATHDFSTLDADLDETKYYCPGVGTVKVTEPDIEEELVESSLL